MLKVSKLADYATVIMAYMAANLSQVHNARDIALHTHIALPTVSKLLKLMSRSGLVASQRGVKGGYQLVRTPEAISIAEIVVAVDGRLAVTDCSNKISTCSLEPRCLIRSNWQQVSHMILQILESLSLAEFIRPLARPHY